MHADAATSWLARHRRVRVVLLAVGVIVLVRAGVWLFSPTPVQRLQAYIGQDLRELSEDEQIDFDGLIGQLAELQPRFS